VCLSSNSCITYLFCHTLIFNIWCLFVVRVVTNITAKEIADLVFFNLVVILWIRSGRNANSPDALEMEHTINLVQAQIKSDLVDYEDFQGLDSYATAERLTRIIDDYTPM